MIAINAITASDPQAASDKTKSMGLNHLGKNDFLKLLVQQVQHQDPLNPMDSTDFTAQLAEFSQLEQLTQVNDKLSELKLYQESINNALAISLIGKDIKVKGDQITLRDGKPVKLGYSLDKDAASVVVAVTDGNGRQVASLSAGNQQAGYNEMSWNGKDADGNPLPDGTYSFSVLAKDSDGNTINSSPFMFGKVNGVEFVNGKPYLTTDHGKYAMSDVISVQAGEDQQPDQSSASMSDTNIPEETDNTQNG